MPMIIKEDFDSLNGLSVSWEKRDLKKMSVKESSLGNDDCQLMPDAVIAEYQAVHESMTRNFTYYTKESIISSINSWTKPYFRPIIMHHNDKNGKIIGRIHSAEYTNIDTLSGTGALKLVGQITDKDGKEGAIDGRLKTVSIGAIVHEAYCSICNQNIAENGECEHERGVVYDDALCYWRIVRMEAKELSYVIVPSDIYAQHIKITKGQLSASKMKIKESMEEKSMPGKEKTKEELIASGEIDNEEEKEENLSVAAENERLANEKIELDQKLAEANEKIATAQKEIEDMKAIIAEKDTALENEKKEARDAKSALTIKEAELKSIEDDLIQKKESKRSMLIDSISEMRQVLGKRMIAKEDMSKKSDEYLEEHSLDLKEELSTKEKKQEEKEDVTNPGIINTDKPHVKEDKSNSNINVEESMMQIMAGLMSPNRI